MKKKILRGLALFAIGFVIVFILRLIYGYITYPDGKPQVMQGSQFQVNQNFSFNVRNYASYQYKKSAKTGVHTYSVDQKYEKIANIKTSTEKIDESEKQVRDLIKSHDSIIQYEQKSGVKVSKNRIINLAIGVPPGKFDELVVKLKSIGKIISINIDKKDKTNEYKKLKAKKNSLLTIRKSLIALKNRGGKIDEYIKLENRILEIEKEIQGLGINLGEFDSENEFCTIKFTLLEASFIKSSISFFQRLSVAFSWSMKFYFGLTVFLFFASLTILIINGIISNSKWIQNLLEKTS
jgi:hypothetical protein